MAVPKSFLNPPTVQAVRYEKNFIQTAVCELRFPTLLELEAMPPREFQSRIRRDYPFYEPQILENLSGPEITREHRYLFRSKDQQWTVTIKSFALALETSKYVDFEDFFERLKRVLMSAKEMIDADFFTRVGLRYINRVPIADGNIEGWIRPELIQPLTGGTLGTVKALAATIHGYMENGQYSFRHGFKEPDETEKTSGQYYTLDFDYFSENVEAEMVEDLIKQFNKKNFAFFSWCLGSEALRTLGKGTPK